MFVVSENVVLRAGKKTMAGYGSFYSEIASNAISMRNPASVSAAKGNYMVVVFAKDRISPDTKLEVWPSSTKSKVDGEFVGYKMSTQYLVFDPGWTIGVFPAQFPQASGRPFWTKVVYTSLDSYGKQESYLTGLFSSEATAVSDENKPAGHPKSAVNQAARPKIVVIAEE